MWGLLPNMRWTLLAFLSLPLGAGPVAGQTVPKVPLTVSGDLRSGYFSMNRNERDGTRSSTDDFRARLRIGGDLRLSEVFSAKVRLAGRFSTEQEAFGFALHNHPPTIEGMPLGEATLDEAYLNFRPSEQVDLRAGRFQSKFALPDLTGKSLDRSDSPNTDITWTDGVHLVLGTKQAWMGHLILQHNAAHGASNTLRAPLNFEGAHSRVTYFAALENTTPAGPIVQRGLDLTYIPDALRVDGGGAGRTVDYVSLVARGATQWPVSEGRLIVGGELGYAPNRPTKAAMGLANGSEERTGGIAYQVAASVVHPSQKHRLGLVYGRAEPGWLVAPDYRNNDRLLEGRYQWQFTRNHSLEVRLRQRRDLERPVAAERRREDLDFYLRITSRF